MASSYFILTWSTGLWEKHKVYDKKDTSFLYVENDD